MAHSPKRVIVIGCGGIGTWLSHGLVRALQFQAPMSALILVDGDTFQEKNFERQAFEVMGLKSHSLRASLQPIALNTFVVSQPAWIVSEEFVKEIAEDDEGVANITAESLLQEGDYVFCVVDNYAARKLVFDAAAKLNNIDVFTGGNDEALYGSVYHYHRRDGRDITSHPGVYHDEFVNPDDKNPGELSCQERAELDGGTQLLAVNMAVASALLAKAAHVIFGTEDQKAKAIENAEIFFDLSMCEMSSSDRRTEEAILPVPAL